MRIHAVVLPLLLPLLLAGAPPVSGEVAAPPEDLASIQRRIRDLARLLAKAAFAEELELCLVGLAATGATGKEMSSIRGVTDKLLERAKPPSKPERLLARYADSAQDLASRLAELAAEQQSSEIAASALLFDQHNQRAHELVGHVRCADGVWREPEVAAWHDRRREIQTHLHRAMQLEIPLEAATPSHPLMVEALGGGGSAWTHQGLTIESAWPAEKLAAVFRDILRAMAFSRWLLEGELSPRHHGGLALHLPRPLYLHLVKRASAEGLIDEARRETALVADFNYVRREVERLNVYETWAAVLTGTEGYLRSALFKLYDDSLSGWGWSAWVQDKSEVPLWAAVGHKNLVALSCLGAPLPDFVVPEKDGWVPAIVGDEPEYSLARAGLIGGRLWLRQQALAGSAPGLDIAMMEEVSLISGLKLLVATSACEMLHEEGSFARVLQDYAELHGSEGTEGVVRRSEKALGLSVPEFGVRWSAWLRPEQSICLRETLLARIDAAAGVAGEAAMRRFDELRQMVGLESIESDPELSEGAALHAEYLHHRPERARQGPAALQESPDEEHFTAAGAWAGRHALVAHGGAEKCIDEWLATFYHRLPLVHPGLHRVGFGQSGDLCVLDAQSVVDPAGEWWMPYPYPEQDGVPLRHGSAAPNPVPEREDQTTLGFPITLQLGPKIKADDMTMKLEKMNGGAATEVACFFSSPMEPTNPRIAPDRAWCLIPFEPLQPRTTYRVGVVVEGIERAWKFTTK